MNNALTAQVSLYAAPSTEFFDTLYEGVSAWYNFYAAKFAKDGFLPVEDFDDRFSFDWSPMGYEANQRKSYEFSVEKIDKRGKAYTVSRWVHISVYRMPSGRYEVNSYNA